MRIARISLAFSVMLGALSLAAPCGAASGPVRFAVVGDAHLGLRGEDAGLKMTRSSERLFEMTVDQLNAMDLGFVVFAGDNVVDGESFNLSRFKEIADNLRVPYFLILGNHDQPLIPPETWTNKTRGFYPGETKSSVAAMFRGHGFGPDGRTWWSADVAGLHLVGLDTAQIKSWGGVVPRRQLEWMKADLAANAGKPTLIFAHHNLVEFRPEYGLKKEYMVENRDEIRAVLAAAPQVKAVFGAHLHFSDHREESGIHYYTTPSINTYPNRFAVFELMPGTLAMRTQPVGAGRDAAEGERIRARAKEELGHADWIPGLIETLKARGKPHDVKDAQAAMYDMFEGVSSVPAGPVR